MDVTLQLFPLAPYNESNSGVRFQIDHAIDDLHAGIPKGTRLSDVDFLVEACFQFD